jgi:hypothetical protein
MGVSDRSDVSVWRNADTFLPLTLYFDKFH